MSRTIARLALFALACISPACGGTPPPPPPPPTILALSLVDAVTLQPVGGGDVVFLDSGGRVLADMNGAISLEVEPGTYRLRASAPGHLTRPGPYQAQVLVVAAANQTTTVQVPLEPRPGAPASGGTIEGKVTVGGMPQRDVLVVAESTTVESGLTDVEGRYRLLGLQPNNYQVQGYLRGQSAPVKMASIEAGGSQTVNLDLAASAGATAGGRIGDGSGTTSVSIALASTGDPVPGLSERVMFGATWSLDGVPPGRYVARAFFEDDGRVLDPDVFRRREEPAFRITGTASATANLPTTPAVAGLMVRTASGTASFSWSSFPDADFYVVEVSNLLGQVLWGGLDVNRRPAFRVLAPQTEVDYGATVPPIEPLVRGRTYRVRIYAGIDVTTGTLFELKGASEEAAGQFRVQ